MARLYANENLPFPVVEELRRLGHDVLTTYESGQAGKATPDEDVLGFSLADCLLCPLTFSLSPLSFLHRPAF